MNKKNRWKHKSNEEKRHNESRGKRTKVGKNYGKQREWQGYGWKTQTKGKKA